MYTDIKNVLLKAKDEKLQARQKFLNTHPVLLTLQALRVGVPKNTKHTQLSLKLFNQLILQVFSPRASHFHSSQAGDSYFYAMDLSAETLKKMAIYIEKHHPLGRFVDLDVVTAEGPFSRQILNQAPRKCFLCNEPAHKCAVLKRHDTETLNAFTEKHIEKYLVQFLAENAMNALRKELFLYPKFGLVSGHDQGVHIDMHAGHFLASIDSLKDYFKDVITHGFKTISIDHLRQLGKLAEKNMYEATGYVNTHKGIVFIFGSFLPFYTQAILHNKTLEECLDSLQEMITPLVEKDFLLLQERTPISFGERCFINYRILGIRGEVKHRFPSIFSWYNKLAVNDYQKLLLIASNLDDTTIVKRTNYELLKAFQSDCKAFLKEPFKIENYKHFSDHYKAQNVSPGGAADLLSLVFLLESTDFLIKNSP